MGLYLSIYTKYILLAKFIFYTGSHRDGYKYSKLTQSGSVTATKYSSHAKLEIISNQSYPPFTA